MGRFETREGERMESEVSVVMEVEAEEQRLVQALRAASPEAIHALTARFGPRLHWYAAVRLGGDALLAEDVVIESLADALRNLQHYDSRRSTLSAWLYGIARRKIRGELRRQRWQKSVPRTAQVPLTEEKEWTETRDLAERAAARLHAQRQVAELATVLTETEFEVLVLHGIAELSAREIGQAVGRSERAIHSILHRARQKARERLVRDEG